MFRLNNKRALVTGGASGIGAAVVDTLRAQGALVQVLDLDQRADFRCDVTDPDSVAHAFAQAGEAGALDILVCSAGIGFVGDILNTAPSDFDRLMAVNARGVFLCCQEAVRRMKTTGRGGSIVNICSIAAETALAERFAYSATKGAVLAMTRCIAKDFVADAIRCNCVCPARVHTPFVDAYLAKNYPGREAEQFALLSAAQPMGRMGRPEEVAALVTYLCSEEAGFITGVAYDIDGGVMAMR
jgi:NAD(P)-dependent dehydrogenase (short-subunit alcohol dehydrogenase family)